MKYILSICLLIGFCACSSPKSHTFTGVSMTIPYKIIVADSLNETKIDSIQNVIDSVFHKVNANYNHWNANSTLSQINSLPEGEAPCTDEILELFHLSDQLHIISKGKFDPSYGRLITRWKEALENGEVLTLKELAFYRGCTGWDKLIIRDGSILKTQPLAFDFDSIAKGYAIDSLENELKKLGYDNLYIEWGGDIKVSGYNGKKGNWNIAIAHPEKPEPIETVGITNLAIATSGNYIQQWQIGEKTYTHFLHPETYIPMDVSKSLVLSATVTAPSCALADGLATTCCLFTKQTELNEWIAQIKEQMPEVNFWIVTR